MPGILSTLASFAPELITGGATLGSSLLSFFGQKGANYANSRENSISRWYDAYKTVMQNKFQKEMYDYTFEKENAYNTPEAQARRYRDAGFNPYVMMQNSSSLGASATTLSSGSGGAPSPIPMQNPFENFSQLANIGLTMAQARKTNVEADDLESTRPYRINESEAKAIQHAADAAAANAKAELDKFQLDTNKKLQPHQIDQIIETNKQIAALAALYGEQKKTEKAQQNLYGSQAYAATQQAYAATQQANSYAELARKYGLEARLLELDDTQLEFYKWQFALGRSIDLLGKGLDYGKEAIKFIRDLLFSKGSKGKKPMRPSNKPGRVQKEGPEGQTTTLYLD